MYYQCQISQKTATDLKGPNARNGKYNLLMDDVQEDILQLLHCTSPAAEIAKKNQILVPSNKSSDNVNKNNLISQKPVQWHF